MVCGCPRQAVELPADAARQVSAPAEEAAPSPVVAHFIFVVPPADGLYPEREVLTTEFSEAAQQVFPAAGWEYRELKLSEHVFTEWRGVMRDEIDSFPMVIFSYHPCYAAFLCDLAERPDIREASYILALTPVKEDASPLITVLEFRTEELGFLAGAALAGRTMSGHLATICFDDEVGARFTTGFRQGAGMARSGATHAKLFVKRSDLIGGVESAEYLQGILDQADDRYGSRMSIDAVALMLGPLAEPFVGSLAGSEMTLTLGPIPMDEVARGLVLTSTCINFGNLPGFIVDHANELNLLRPSRPVGPAGKLDERLVPGLGGHQQRRAVKYVSVGLADGLVGCTGFQQYQRFRSLPDDFLREMEYYSKSILTGEIRVVSGMEE